jgi:hypothetical protein
VSAAGENDTVGLNVTVSEEVRASNRGKMSHRDNISKYGERDVVKQVGQNVTE